MYSEEKEGVVTVDSSFYCLQDLTLGLQVTKLQLREYSDVQIRKAIDRQSEWTYYAVDRDICNLVRLPHLGAESLTTGSAAIEAEEEPVELSRMFLVSEFDFKRRTISASLDSLFTRSAETYMLDNRDRICELNKLLEGKVKIAEDPILMEHVPVLDPGKLVFTSKTAAIACPTPQARASPYP